MADGIQRSGFTFTFEEEDQATFDAATKIESFTMVELTAGEERNALKLAAKDSLQEELVKTSIKQINGKTLAADGVELSQIWAVMRPRQRNFINACFNKLNLTTAQEDTAFFGKKKVSVV